MKLFYVSTWRSDDLKISECEVVKETEKTYVVILKLWGKMTIKKKEMTGYNALFAPTYDEAVVKAVRFAKQRIDNNKDDIECCQREISRYERIIKRLKGEEE